MSPIDVVLSRVEARESAPGRWRAACPVCGGRNRSTLSIGEGDTGAVLIRCFKSECSAESIASALGLELQDLFPSKPARPGDGAPPMRKRRLLPAHQALQVLEEDLTLAIGCMSQMARGEALDEAARDSLLSAAAHVVFIRDEVAA